MLELPCLRVQLQLAVEQVRRVHGPGCSSILPSESTVEGQIFLKVAIFLFHWL